MKRKEKMIFLMVAIIILVVAGIVLYLNHFYGFFMFSSPHFNQTYVTLRFDDGLVSQKEAFSLINEYNFVGSVYIITSNLNSSKDWEKSYYLDVKGLKEITDFMEIGSHSETHPDLIRSGNYEEEIVNSKKTLVANGFNVTTFVYPAGNYDDKVVKAVKENYDCAVTQDVGTNFVPIRPYLLKDFTVRSYNSLDTIKRVIKPGKWNILAFHDIGNLSTNNSLPAAYGAVAENNAVDLDFFKQILDYIKQKNYTVITVAKGCEMFKDEK